MSKSKILFFYFLVFAFTLVLAESSAFIALKVYKNLRTDIINTGAYDDEIRKEISHTHKNAHLLSYRGYSPLPNYDGKYVITDRLGFRIDENKISKKPKIAVYGGSTVFSVTTNQENTIPDLIKVNGFQALNFGVGGYSTTAEMAAFFESLRHYKDIEIAIFYHGVNELGNYREINKEIFSEKLMGGVYRGQFYQAISNYTKPSISILDSNIFYIINKLFAMKESGRYATEPDKIITDIKNIYFENLKIIQAVGDEYGIKTFFILQPTIYSTDEKYLNKEEKVISSSGYAKKLYPLMVDEILKDRRSDDFKLYDFSLILNNKKDNVFIDWHHLNDHGNEIVAYNMSELIKSNINKNEPK